MQEEAIILTSDKIDAAKWDACVNKHKGLIYTTYFFLNTITDNWKGIIINNYNAVMALPYRRKYGITYLYTPTFSQQLGLEGNYYEKDFSNAMQMAKSFTKYGNYFFNHQNKNIEHLHSFTLRDNYIIDLAEGYDKINSAYSTNFKRILKKTNGLFYLPSENIDSCIQLHKTIIQKKNIHIKNKDYTKFKTICETYKKTNQCIARIVKNENDELLSAAILLKDNHRLYNIINVTTHNGKLQHANHFLMDNIIQEFASCNLLLDLEGSEIPGVKEFYQKMGAHNQPYYHWHFNYLKFPFNLLKH